jgi:hypothetical protein
MQENPNEPTDKAARAETSALQYREILADDRRVALSKYRNGCFGSRPLSCRAIRRPTKRPSWIAACATPGTGRHQPRDLQQNPYIGTKTYAFRLT